MKYIKLILSFIINPLGFILEKGKIKNDKKINFFIYFCMFVFAVLIATLAAYCICNFI